MKINYIPESKARAKFKRLPGCFDFLDNREGKNPALPKAVLMVRSAPSRQVILVDSRRTSGWKQLRGKSRKAHIMEVVCPDQDLSTVGQTFRSRKPFNRSKYNPVTEDARHENKS